MDSSPLVKAHDHARAAALAHTDTTVAVNEHALAAGEFSNAAKTTTSTEALRTLRLLEQHHRRLSELLKFPHDHRPPNSSPEHGAHQIEAPEAPSPAAGPQAGRSSKSDGAGSTDAARAAAQSGASSSAQQQRRYPPSRELSSSIASNLASARGIRGKYRGQPVAPSVSNDQAPGSLDGPSHKEGSRNKMQSMLDQKGKPSWVPPSHPGHNLEHKEAAQPKIEASSAETANASDEGYSRFYSTFGSLINRLSAPLAFAGLPLITEEPAASQPAAKSPEPPTPREQQPRGHVGSPAKTHRFAQDPDLAKIYSKATLRALGRDGHNPNDSFYLVPTTGGTVSYANILSFDQKERRRIAASTSSLHRDGAAGADAGLLISDVADDEDFVDARESQSSLSPGMKKRVGKSQSNKDLQNAVEELYVENKDLKNMLDKLSKRLHAFEANAQNSHLALQSSMRFMRPGSPLSLSGGSGGKKDGGGGEADAALGQKYHELEEEHARSLRHMETLEKECKYLQKALTQYRDRWEKLKAGAKARREAQGSGAENVSDAAAMASALAS